jgi:hypothetical protein
MHIYLIFKLSGAEQFYFREKQFCVLNRAIPQNMRGTVRSFNFWIFYGRNNIYKIDILEASLCLCCSHLEHRAAVKNFVPLQFLNLRQSVGPLGWGISPAQGRYLHRTNADKHPCLEWDPNP